MRIAAPVLENALRDDSLFFSREYLVRALAALGVPSPTLVKEMGNPWHWMKMNYDGALYDGLAMNPSALPVKLLQQQLRLRVRYHRCAVRVREALHAQNYKEFCQALPSIAEDAVRVMVREALADTDLDGAIPSAPKDSVPFSHQAMRRAFPSWARGGPKPQHRRPDDSAETIHKLVQRAEEASPEAIYALCRAIEAHRTFAQALREE
jgi:hypothetical protein